MKDFKVIAFTHKGIGLEKVGQFHIEEDDWQHRLSPTKSQHELDEFMFLSTCNRVEFLFKTDNELESDWLTDFYKSIYPNWSKEEIDWAVNETNVLKGSDAIRHLFHVAGSLDSLVVGEREIITQVRRAFEKCRELGLSGDFIRIAMRKTIETAKQIYTETNIANRPVSIVNLAFKKLIDAGADPQSRILIIGAGQTNTAMVGNLKKWSKSEVIIVNRTLEKAEVLAEIMGAKAMALENLNQYKQGFDILISCTGAAEAIVTRDMYHSLLGEDKDKKFLVDLAIPNDIDPEISKNFNVELITIEDLKEVARKNLREREKEIFRCEEIVEENLQEFERIARARKVELAMKHVPEKVKAIREKAFNEVFAKELEELDEKALEVMQRVVGYMEKKYVSGPMKMAKEIILEEQGKKER